jgi:hypothetical protein
MAERPMSAAASLYPHLPHDAGQPPPRGAQPTLANALYPSLAPKPPQPQPAPRPRPRLTREQAFDWSNVDPRWARLVGLVRTNK